MVGLPRDDRGILESHAWPGGYPILYLDRENSAMCPACAIRCDDEETAERHPEFVPVAAFIHWEGQPITCDDCGNEIESAYGEVATDAGE